MNIPHRFKAPSNKFNLPLFELYATEIMFGVEIKSNFKWS